ncbi:MAG TPA: bifunctional alpha,alpha-trehalose-phosphate synthase (UDP-forming)/trehalose-phosphatase [Gemmatimonadaceae bacterium]|nr:bifunctional alpha,alpha-trehalose-phosphate synthase (UDP-forming)/trehalose-phosphatase [Gemmatimonadaceae bacterium]
MHLRAHGPAREQLPTERSAMTGRRIAVMALRLPVRIRIDEGRATVVPTVGGVATGLARAVPPARRLWIGWPGVLEGLSAEERARLRQELRDRSLVPVELDPARAREFYGGYANRVVWPLFHSLPGHLPLRLDSWDAYAGANAAFARTALEETQEDELIWVHDYQLMLVPRYIREVRPNARIGFFLHIPFPSADVFRVLPQRRDVLYGLMGADQVAFHTADYRAHFVQALRRYSSVQVVDDASVLAHGRLVHLVVAPMGVDVQHFERLGERAVADGTVDAYRNGGDILLIAGVDRLDYTKGIPRRLLAIESLLRRYPEWRGRVRLVQVAVPSRSDVDEYRSITAETERLVGRINGAFGTPQWTPVHYITRALSQGEVSALYRAAQVAAVTPIRDGMNLVAKEFVASRTDEDGVLVLSELAGAASELVEALIVNPYDVDATADRLHEALRMEPAQRKARMRALRRRVREHDVSGWARRLLDDLAAQPPQRRPARPAELHRVITAAAQAPHLVLLLDYDGTLVDFTVRPEAAVPSSETKALLQHLARRPNTTVYLVSGRDRAFLDRVLGGTGVGMVAEHGAWWRRPGTRRWLQGRTAVEGNGRWRRTALRQLREFTERTPGSHLEEKSRSLTWHWRAVKPALGATRAEELALALHQSLPPSASILVGDKVVEVRPHGVDKGAVLRQLGTTFAPDAAIVAIGDDVTDEDMFRALPEPAVTVHVGSRRTSARYRVPDVASVRALLGELAHPRG